MTGTTLIRNPVWLTGPKICPVENLPAFETEKAMWDFHAANSPSCKVVDVYKCAACDFFHMETKAPSPSGASSGTDRGAK